MNINCLNNCKYQIYGKCTLTQINEITKTYTINKTLECPHKVTKK